MHKQQFGSGAAPKCRPRGARTTRAERRLQGVEFFSAKIHGGTRTLTARASVTSFEFVWLEEGASLTSIDPRASGASSSSSSSTTSPSTPSPWVAVATATAINSGAAASLSANLPDGVEIACFPLIGPLLPGYEPPETDSGPASRAQALQQSLTSSCIAQAVFATLDFALNDPITGLIGCGIATLGLQASTSSGFRFLPSYIVLTFCNGTMQILLGAEYFAGVGTHQLMRTFALPLSQKLVQLISFASPTLMFLGLALAWNLHCELRSLALQGIQSIPAPAGGITAVPNEGNAMGAPPGAGGAQAAALAQGAGAGQAAGRFRPFTGEARRLQAKDIEAK